MVLAIAWTAPAAAQEAYDAIGSEISAFTPDATDESYAADPNQSFVVEHSGSVSTTAARASSPAAPRCREYLTDGDDPYESGGLACPQPDGSWKIVTGPDELARERGSENMRRQIPPRARTSYSEDPDYTEDEDVYEDEVRPQRRFRLDWNSWSAERRGAHLRPYRDRSR
ncbi:MAG: hypothetical protein AB7E79_06895 [Rhodospirillaceae bacterium]